MKTKIYLTIISAFVTIILFAQAGTLDESFGRGGKVTTVFGQYGSSAEALAIQADKKLVVVGTQYNATNNEFEVTRYNSDGSLDKTFGTKGNVHTLISSTCHATTVAIQTDDKIIVAGTCSDLTTPSMAVARYNDDGSPDSTFNGTGTVIIAFTDLTSEAYSVLIQPDGKIVVGGLLSDEAHFLKCGLARLNSNGTPDNNFGNNGKVISGFNGHSSYIKKLLLQPDGKILAAGTVRDLNEDDFALLRYKGNGELDNNFGTNGKVSADFGGREDGSGAVLQADGKIIAGGVSNISFVYSLAMIRYKKNGTPDNSFGINGKATNSFGGLIGYKSGAMAIQADGKIVFAGQGDAEHPVGSNYSDFAIARFETNGDPDNSFGTNGLVRTDFRRKTDEASDILIQPNGKIVAAGLSTSALTYAIARYNAGGSGFTDAMTSKTNITIPKEPVIGLYPNPVQNELHIKGLGNDVTNKLFVTDAAGNTLKSMITSLDEISWNIQGIPAGIYYLRIKHDNKTTSLKFVKQ